LRSPDPFGNEQVRIGLVGDIHSNLPALKAVHAVFAQEAVTTVLNCGDFVGYNAFPEQVLQYCRDHRFISIVGNYDLKVLKFPEKSRKWQRKKHPLKWLSFKWTWENLSEDSRIYLRGLPRECCLQVNRKLIHLVHGSPHSINEHLFSTTSEKRFRELERQSKADVIVFGHSHEPFQKKVKDTLFINTGSVGRQDDGDPRATAAILSVGKRVSVRHLKIEYDLNTAVQAILDRGLPGEFAQMILQGRSLDWILDHQ
jgi:putative phosphoesterase